MSVRRLFSAYQIGNMVSAASAQIEAVAGQSITDPVTGVPDYGRVSAILIGVAAFVLIVCCLVGAEVHGAHFERGRAAFEKDAGFDVADDPRKVVSPHPEVEHRRDAGRDDVSMKDLPSHTEGSRGAAAVLRG